MAFASLQSDAPGIAPPSSASNVGNDTSGATKFNDHQSSPSLLPVVTPTDDTKDTILDQPTTIEPPALNNPHHNNVVVASSTSLTKQALGPPPASIFPPPTAAAAALATSSSVYHHPHADGRKKLGVAIKATANMYGSVSPSAGKFGYSITCYFGVISRASLSFCTIPH